MKWAIRLVFTILLLGVIGIVGATALILTLDINKLKPLIQTQLAKQNIDATFAGNLSWTLYPSLAIQANSVELKHSQNKQPLAQIGSARFSVKLMPLLNRELEVNELTLNNSEVWYTPDTLSLLGKTSQPEASTSTETQEQNPQEISLAILKVASTDVVAHVTNPDASISDFTLEHFEAFDINLEGESFPLELRTTIALPQQPVIRAFAAGRIAISPKASTLRSEEFEATIDLTPSANATSESGQITITTQKTHLSWANALALNSQLSVSTPNARNLFNALAINLDTHSPDVLKRMELTSDLALQQQQFALDNLKITLDKTTLTGTVNVNLAGGTGLPPTDAKLKIDEINLDNYLPTPAPETVTPVESAPTPLPIDLINQISAKLALQIESATIKNIALTNIGVDIAAHAGDINIKKLNANLFDGQLKTQAIATTKNNALKVSGESSITNINLQQTLTHFADFKNIAGSANSTVQFSTQGSTDKELTESLSADSNATIPTLTLSPFNLEQQYCEAIAWIEEKQGKSNANIATKQWDTYTQLKPVTLSASLKGNDVNVSNLSADIENIQASAKGALNFSTGEFAFPIDLSLANFSSAPDSCSSIDKKWRELSLPLICKGKLDSIDAKTCLPDTKRINKIIEAKVNAKIDEAKDKAKAELDEKVQKEKDKLKEQADKKIKDALEDLKNDKKAKELEDKLKQILGNGKSK